MREARAIGGHSHYEWKLIQSMCGGRCLRCGAGEITKDHVVPVSSGGDDSMGNIQPLCYACNSQKHIDATDYRPVWWAPVSKRAARALVVVQHLKTHAPCAPEYMNIGEYADYLANIVFSAAPRGLDGISEIDAVYTSGRTRARSAARIMRSASKTMGAI
jgi:hypothetical protein